MSDHAVQGDEYVLVERNESKAAGRPIYFIAWASFGPMTSPDVRDARRYATRADALAAPIHEHDGSTFDVEPAPAVPK